MRFCRGLSRVCLINSKTRALNLNATVAHLSTFPPKFEPVFGAGLSKHLKNTAIIDETGQYNYAKLLGYSKQISGRFAQEGNVSKDRSHRVAFLCPADIRYVATMWATWLGANTAVPLFYQHPDAMLEYYVKDCQATVVATTKEFIDRMTPLAKAWKLPLIQVDTVNIDSVAEATMDDLPVVDKKADALMMYTSGTTGPPKGVVLTYDNIHFQTCQIRDVWEWTSKDVMLHSLPLHHTHGIISGLLTPNYAGATCMMLPKFDPETVWKHLLHMIPTKPAPTVFMAVPTMYVKLIEYFDQALVKSVKVDQIREAFSKYIRFCISGSASLPEPIYRRFQEITGIEILERYGMTEVGVPLSNKLKGQRFAGCVGYATRGVEVCVASLDSKDERKATPLCKATSDGVEWFTDDRSQSGELLLKGANVFRCYWNKPEKTTETFTHDGWFKTGDEASCDDKGVFKILGRMSADIIKSGGYKVSSLEVERHLLSRDDVAECVVVGVPDLTWGEKVVAVVVLRPGKAEPSLEDIRAYCKERMPVYYAPVMLKIVPALTRNFLGKVNKKELVKQMFPK